MKNSQSYEKLLLALQDEKHAFTSAELEDIIERAFCDDAVPLNPELVDAAIYRLAVLAGEPPTPQNLQQRYTQTAYRYLRRSLGLADE